MPLRLRVITFPVAILGLYPAGSLLGRGVVRRRALWYEAQECAAGSTPAAPWTYMRRLRRPVSETVLRWCPACCAETEHYVSMNKCKVCVRAVSRAWYLKNREQRRKSLAKWMADNPQWAKDYFPEFRETFRPEIRVQTRDIQRRRRAAARARAAAKRRRKR